MLSVPAAKQATSVLFHTSATFQRISELLNSPVLKIRLRALIDLIILPLDKDNERADIENRRQLLRNYQRSLNKKTTTLEPFDKLIDELQDPNIFISSMLTRTQQLCATQIFATEFNLPNRHKLNSDSSLVEHQLLTYALLYFNDTTRVCSELLTTQNCVVNFSHCKLIHLILLRKRGLLIEDRALLTMIKDDTQFIDDNLLALERGASISDRAQAFLINKFELFACFDEVNELIRINWIPRLINILKTSFDVEQRLQSKAITSTEAKQQVQNKVIAFHCIKPLLQVLSPKDIEQMVLPFWLTLLSMDQEEYMSDTETYDPKTVRYFNALNLFLFEILPLLSGEAIKRVIDSFFDRFNYVDIGDFRHHIAVTCVVLIPYCDLKSLTDLQLKILVSHCWDLLHISRQLQAMNLTDIKDAIVYRVFSLLVDQKNMPLLIPYFYKIVDKEDEIDFFGEISRVWLKVALDCFSPELITVLFARNNINLLVKILLSTIESEWLYTPYEELKLLHKLIYLLPPELLASNTLDTIWVNVYNNMCEEPDAHYQICYLAVLLTLGMRLPVEKLFMFLSQNKENIINFLEGCFDIFSDHDQCFNSMTMVFDAIIQRLVVLNHPEKQGLIQAIYQKICDKLSQTSEKQTCYLWIIVRLLPHCSSPMQVEQVIRYFNKGGIPISLDDPSIPEKFLKNFAMLSAHLPINNLLQLYPYTMLAIGQLLNANLTVDDIFVPMDSLVLSYSCSVVPEYSQVLFQLIMKGLTSIIMSIDSAVAARSPDHVLLREKALRNFLAMLSSYNSPDHICEYLFPILPALIQFYPKFFEQIYRASAFVQEFTTRQAVIASDKFSRIIENPYLAIILLFNQSTRHKEALIKALCNCIKPSQPSNVNIYLLASLLRMGREMIICSNFSNI